jgi:hypothetical protein
MGMRDVHRQYRRTSQGVDGARMGHGKVPDMTVTRGPAAGSYGRRNPRRVMYRTQIKGDVALFEE